MAGLDDFTYVKDIPGVSEFVLVRQDGHIVVHDSQDSDRLGQMVMLCGINCDAIKTGIPNRFNYLQTIHPTMDTLS